MHRFTLKKEFSTNHQMLFVAERYLQNANFLTCQALSSYDNESLFS